VEMDEKVEVLVEVAVDAADWDGSDDIPNLLETRRKQHSQLHTPIKVPPKTRMLNSWAMQLHGPFEELYLVLVISPLLPFSFHLCIDSQ